MPKSGGWLDQTNKYIEVMNFIDAEVIKKGKENGEQQLRDNSKPKR